MLPAKICIDLLDFERQRHGLLVVNRLNKLRECFEQSFPDLLLYFRRPWGDTQRDINEYVVGMTIRDAIHITPHGPRTDATNWQRIKSNGRLVHRFNKGLDIEVNLEIC